MPCGADAIKISLGIPELEVLGIEEAADKISIEVKRKTDFEICPECGHSSEGLHSSWTTHVRDLPLGAKETWLKVLKRRFRCQNGCKVFAEHFVSLEKYQRQTKRYQAYLESQCRKQSVQGARNQAKVSYKLMERLYYKKAQAKANDFQNQELPRVLGVDEFRGKRNGPFHVLLTDMSQKNKARLWDILKEKGSLNFYQHFKKYGQEARDKVEVVVQDMDQGFRAWNRSMFRKAIIVVDKFHVVKNLLKYLEAVRKEAYRKSQDQGNKQKIGKAYWLLRKRSQNLDAEQREQLEELWKASKVLAEAYKIKEDLIAWYDAPKRRSQAQRELDYLYERIKAMPKLRGFCWTLDNWGDEILNYFAVGYTNAFTEGMNNKIKTLKRQAYGFRNFERFRTRILVECGLY